MTNRTGRTLCAIATATLAAGALFSGAVQADGEAGEHVEAMHEHIDTYVSDARAMTETASGLADAYAGGEAADPQALIDKWESVKLHAAIETTAATIYASIWQGIYGVKEAIEKERPDEAVREQVDALDHALWQGVGAVRLAAMQQKRGGGPGGDDARGHGASGPVATIGEIEHNLDRVVAEYAEGETKEAKELVHSTYMERFEGIEGLLIEQDAELVEALEKDFNVTLPRLIDQGAELSELRGAVDAMKEKLERAEGLAAKAGGDKEEVF
ncbi:hypothetical protein [Arhodomonas sp. KWT]|uniref:hypothetical protein n=1 Tax=Arhodomonas sp. KWT TaxID=2679915 RepID=UPI0013D501A1|nr:hypothetical protein [Arhodomonas sp. KWT]